MNNKRKMKKKNRRTGGQNRSSPRGRVAPVGGRRRLEIGG
jgi:hypothetical protein